MPDKREPEGVVAQGRFLFGKIEAMNKETDRFIWPANPDDVVKVLILGQEQQDYLKVFLLSENRSFSSDNKQIRSITGIDARIIISSSIATPDMFVKPRIDHDQ